MGIKIKLIYPKGHAFPYNKNYSGIWYPKLTFPVLASYSPEEVEEIEITDEEFEMIDFDDPVDLVGITTLTSNSQRAYEIAAIFRERNVKVVIGGMHASSVPEEATKYADSVVIGEGEELWPVLIKDFLKNEMGTFYRSSKFFDMRKYRRPRLDLLSKYLTNETGPKTSGYKTIAQFELSRGCPYKCHFCSVTNFYGNKIRVRDLDKVIEDIRDVKLSYRTRIMGFVDDNLFGNKIYFRKLLKALPALNISWMGQVSVNVINDPKLIKMMADSGCRSLFIGFESLSAKSLTSIGKKINNIDLYCKLMDSMVENKIKVIPSFMFGLDGDEPDIFEKTCNFLKPYKDSISYCTFNISTPLPGTQLYKRMLAENRIIKHDWKYYDFNNVVIRPFSMSAQELKEGFDWICRQFEVKFPPGNTRYKQLEYGL